MATDKNVSTALDIPNFDTKNWTEEQVGFAPYWEPKKGAKIMAQIIQKDAPEESFVRYLMRAGQDMECSRGAKGEDEEGNKQDAEKVLVKKGEYFTVSVYFSLQGLFEFYLVSGLKPWMEITAVEKVKTSKPGRTAWQWKVRVSPEDKRKADQLRAAAAAAKQMSNGAEGQPAQMES